MSDIDLTDISASLDLGGSRPLRGYLATPTGAGPWPGVVVVHEAFGLDDVMCRQADRLAEAGYLSLMPDLFSEGGARRCLVSTIRASLTGEGRAYADIEAAKSALSGREDCTGRIGIIGFCMGGAFALLSASRGYDVASVNYGKVPADIDAVLADACPIVASYGGRDVALKGETAKLEDALTRAGVVHDVKEYPNAGHAFLDDALPGPGILRPIMKVAHIGPEPVSAADAWRRIEAFFAAHLA